MLSRWPRFRLFPRELSAVSKSIIAGSSSASVRPTSSTRRTSCSWTRLICLPHRCPWIKISCPIVTGFPPCLGHPIVQFPSEIVSVIESGDLALFRLASAALLSATATRLYRRVSVSASPSCQCLPIPASVSGLADTYCWRSVVHFRSLALSIIRVWHLYCIILDMRPLRVIGSSLAHLRFPSVFTIRVLILTVMLRSPLDAS
ncbi:hypothetical protein C8R45DRAFT_1135168 [Mycena sanguinolenta]|nr:hypothetical protein C8R45DRAFT_1135168 [Mycena sanguinolenta]